jgi:hypothetical protein
MSILLSPILEFSEPGIYKHWCDGCNRKHKIWTSDYKGTGPEWIYNNNPEAPTFNPSVRLRYDTYDCTDEVYDEYMDRWIKDHSTPKPFEVKEVICHYFIREGFIDYCVDSTHELAGQKIKLSDFPPETE